MVIYFKLFLFLLKRKIKIQNEKWNEKRKIVGDKHKSACIFVRNKNYVVMKQHIRNNFKAKISWEFIMTFMISTLCSGRHMQVIKTHPGTSFKWSLVELDRWSLYRQKFDLKA